MKKREKSRKSLCSTRAEDMDDRDGPTLTPLGQSEPFANRIGDPQRRLPGTSKHVPFLFIKLTRSGHHLMIFSCRLYTGALGPLDMTMASLLRGIGRSSRHLQRQWAINVGRASCFPSDSVAARRIAGQWTSRHHCQKRAFHNTRSPRDANKSSSDSADHSAHVEQYKDFCTYSVYCSSNQMIDNGAQLISHLSHLQRVSSRETPSQFMALSPSAKTVQNMSPL